MSSRDTTQSSGVMFNATITVKQFAYDDLHSHLSELGVWVDRDGIGLSILEDRSTKKENYDFDIAISLDIPAISALIKTLQHALDLEELNQSIEDAASDDSQSEGARDGWRKAAR